MHTGAIIVRLRSGAASVAESLLHVTQREPTDKHEADLMLKDPASGEWKLCSDPMNRVGDFPGPKVVPARLTDDKQGSPIGEGGSLQVPVLEKSAVCFQNYLYHTSLDSRNREMHERGHKAFSKGALDISSARVGPSSAGDHAAHPTHV